MKRRSFIQSSLCAAAATTAILPVAHGGEFKGIIKKAMKFHNVAVPELSIADRFRLLKDLGFDGVELSVSHAKQSNEFIAAREKTGLPIHGLVNAANPNLVAAIQFCSAVGGSGILITAPYDRKRPLMESWKLRQDMVRKALPTAEKHKVKILVENVWAGFLISALDAQRFVDEVDNPWFGVYFDVGNNVRWGVPAHWIEILGARIGKLDIKEWDERKHRGEGLAKGFSSELGDGTIDWAHVRAALKQIGYSGWATAEVGNADRTRLADIARRMDSILDLA